VLRYLSKVLDPAEFHDGPNDAAWREATRIVAVATVIRLALALAVPLFPDEAYYWDWSRRLAPGYFDHPPVIAWLVRLGTLVFGATRFGVRVGPILAGTGCTLAVIRIARSLGGDAAARLAALVFVTMPIVAVGSVLATPDLPMLCAAAWTLYAVLRALGLPARAHDADAPSEGAHALRWWLIAGAAIGVAMASKYTAVLIPVGVGIAFVFHGRLQNRFGQPGPYAAVALATVVMLPVLWWNFTHDWVSFRFQLNHGLGAPKGGVLGATNRELELIGGQVGLVSPILAWYVIRALRDAIRFSEEGFRLVIGMASLVPLAFFAYSATRRSVEANWPALAWIGAVPLLASDPPHSARGRTWLGCGIVLAAALSTIVYVHAAVPFLPIPASRDPVARAHGWDVVAAAAQRKRTFQAPGRDPLPPEQVFIGAERYQDAAELAFHLPGNPPTFSMNLTGRPNQYDIWPQYREVAPNGALLILVLDDERSEPRVIRKLSCCVTRIDQSEGVSLMRGDGIAARKRIWILQGKGDSWPSRDQPFPPQPGITTTPP
jgi:4-amino-4-deoxy-L-arabinose transferase-like glycosyltransferase